LVRFEDIDTSRCRDIYYESIIDDLEYLGIPLVGTPLKQSNRQSAYNDALQSLKDKKLVYPCFCSRKMINEELSRITNAPHGPEGAHYPGTCKNLSTSEVAQRMQDGEIPSWRFNSEQAAALYSDLTFQDEHHSPTQVDPFLLGDTILSRKDIGTSYHIAVVVDDDFQNITHVTRGEDLLHATHLHRILQEALGLSEVVYHHHPLVCDDHGKRLAKSHTSADSHVLLKNLRTSTIEGIIQQLPQLP